MSFAPIPDTLYVASGNPVVLLIHRLCHGLTEPELI